MNINVLCGGMSTEHEISLRSAKSIINNLDRKKYNVRVTYIDKSGRFFPLGNIDHVDKESDLIKTSDISLLDSIKDFIEDVKKSDYIIPCIHGTSGEDGQIQGFLKTLNKKYIGNGILSSAICMDKAVTNEILKANDIRQAKFLIIKKDQVKDLNYHDLWKEIEEDISKTVFVKPANNGSSVGVNRAKDEKELEFAINDAFKYTDKVLIEEEIIGIELEVSVFGNNKDNIHASLPGSYSTERDMFDYTAKYNDPKLVRNIPHKLPEEKTKEIRKLAEKAYRTLDCRGFARVDIFMDKDGNFYVNEINTFPGMTMSSLSADLWKATNNTSYMELLDNLISLAEEYYGDK